MELSILNGNIFEIIGILLVLYVFLYKPLSILINWYWNNRLYQNYSSKVLTPSSRNDDYAVITGASDGIGAEYAGQLAKKGFNLFLLSRTEKKLVKLSAEIRKQFPQCKHIQHMTVDFSRSDIYESIEHKLKTLNGKVYILVNNVGTIHHVPEYFANYPNGFNISLINTNIVSVTAMSEIVLRIMMRQPKVRRETKTNGIIINISAGMALSPHPMWSTYAASKVYMDYLSSSLATEYAAHNILVQNVLPNLVWTKMGQNFPTPYLAVEASDFVGHALNSVGVEQVTSGHPKHKVLNNISRFIQSILWEPLYMAVKFRAAKKIRKDCDKLQKIKN